jgi:hypothetical protein
MDEKSNMNRNKITNSNLKQTEVTTNKSGARKT